MSEKSKTESRYVLAACVKPVELGKEFTKLPPHITILPPCNIEDEKLEIFINGIAEGAKDWLPISGLTGYPVLFGENKNIPVLPIKFMEPGVFCNAVMTADQLGVVYDRKFAVNYVADEDYSESRRNFVCTEINHPHITNFEILKSNEWIEITEMQLFCLSAIKKVVAVFNNKGLKNEE